jgi:hypothetical protein
MGTPQVAMGDVLLARSGGAAGWWIRFGSALRDKPNLANHVAVVHHTDPNGTVWCIEGRPGGTGWRDARSYLASPWLLTNAGQLKTPAQREAVAAAMTALVGTPYDWEAIVADAATDLGWELPGWDPTWHGTVPAHVLCSNAAAWAYAKAGLPRPAGERASQPADWAQFILTRAWAK